MIWAEESKEIPEKELERLIKLNTHKSLEERFIWVNSETNVFDKWYKHWCENK